MCIYFTISKMVSGAVLFHVCASICLSIINKEDRASSLHFMKKEASSNTENENIQVSLSVCALPHC